MVHRIMNTSDIEERVSSISEQIDTKIVSLENDFKNHIETHDKYDESYRNLELEIIQYLEQQMQNTKILQCYIEKELFLSEIEVAKAKTYMEALANTPFYKKLTKTQREGIKINAYIAVDKEFSDRLYQKNIALSSAMKAASDNLQRRMEKM